MKDYFDKLHFRKFSPIDREYPIFELVEDDCILLDISATDDGVIDVSINPSACTKLFRYEQLAILLEEGIKLLKAEMES
jgi:hypothetical protein